MADIKRHATATWQGDTETGTGEMSAQSGEFTDLPFSFPSRFDGGKGTNPEELIGAAHAACFNMVIAKELSESGTPPQRLETRATVTLSHEEDGFAISRIHLQTKGRVADIDESTFLEVARTAKNTCPVSQLLMPGVGEMTLEAQLI